jgi:group I intron endonuclease
MVEAVIYLCRCLTTNKVYVGSASKFSKRRYDHLRGLKSGKHTNAYLQSAFNKYGETNFVFEMIETCDAELRYIREQYWIDQYKASDPEFGFNLVHPVRAGPAAQIMSEFHSQYWAGLTDEERFKRTKHLTDPNGNRKGNQDRMNERWKDPNFRKKVVSGLSRARAENNANPTPKMLKALDLARLKAIARMKSPEGRLNQRENNLRQYQNPRIREIRLEALSRGREKTNLWKRIQARMRRRKKPVMI